MSFLCFLQIARKACAVKLESFARACEETSSYARRFVTVSLLGRFNIAFMANVRLKICVLPKFKGTCLILAHFLPVMHT